MRSGAAMVLALAGVGLLPAATHRDRPQQTPSAPVIVAGVPVTMAQARERAGTRADDDQVIDALDELTLARWVAGEAAKRGVRADPKRVAAGIRRERAADHRVDAAARAQMAETVLRRALVRSVTAGAHSARSWSTAFDDLNDRWRAVTRCARGTTAPRDRCANLPLSSDRCRWMAFGDVCHLPSEWFTNVDLVGRAQPAWAATSTACPRVTRRCTACAPTSRGPRRRCSSASSSTWSATPNSSPRAAAPMSSWRCARWRT
jgi:hypothetical protein